MTDDPTPAPDLQDSALGNRSRMAELSVHRPVSTLMAMLALLTSCAILAAVMFLPAGLLACERAAAARHALPARRG